jgi:hypothetical protein
MRDEADFLAVRVDERKAARGLHEGERQARKSGTGSDISDPLSHKVGVNRQAVEQMMGEHLFLAFDRGEVERAVPALKLIQKRAQTRAIPGSESDAQRCSIAQQALE